MLRKLYCAREKMLSMTSLEIAFCPKSQILEVGCIKTLKNNFYGTASHWMD